MCLYIYIFAQLKYHTYTTKYVVQHSTCNAERLGKISVKHSSKKEHKGV